MVCGVWRCLKVRDCFRSSPGRFIRVTTSRSRQSLNPLNAWWAELLEIGMLEGADPLMGRTRS